MSTRAGARPVPGDPASGDTASLEAERDFLLRSLDDLDAERAAGNIDDEAYATLRDDYTARAAAVVRALRDGVDARPLTPPVSARRRVLTWTGIATFAVLAGLALAAALGARLPGQTATGNAQVTADDRRADLRAAAEARPDDVPTRLAYARFLMGERDWTGALREFGAVNRLDPANVEARAYGGWILYVGLGAPNEALTSIDRALTLDPGYADARFFRGVVLFRGLGQPGRAIPELQRYLVLEPEGPLSDQVRTLLAEAVAEDARSPGGTTTPPAVPTPPAG